MWSLHVVVVVVALTTVWADDSGATYGTRGAMQAFMEPRLGTAAMRLGRIEKNLEHLRERIEEAAEVDGEQFLAGINERLDHVEAKTDHCDTGREIRCGRDTLECVNTLLLCDGHDDCHNGYDESEDVCDAGPAVVGHVYTGTAHWTSCTHHEDHPVKLTITQTYKSKIFGARIKVKGVFSADFTEGHGEDHHEYDVKGYYVYGSKKLALFPEDEEDAKSRLGVVCDFVHGNDESAECILGSEVDLHQCAKFHLSLHEEEH